MSELQLLDHPVATVMRIAPVISGLSVLLFGLGAYLIAPSRFAFTALTSVAVAANFIAGGIYIAGSPMHGLYGVGLFIPLVPAFFAAEAGLSKRVSRVSLAAALVVMAYMWLNVSGLDPYRGLTQRVAIFVIFGWYSFASYQLLRMRGSAEVAAESAGASEIAAEAAYGLDLRNAVARVRTDHRRPRAGAHGHGHHACGRADHVGGMGFLPAPRAH